LEENVNYTDTYGIGPRRATFLLVALGALCLAVPAGAQQGRSQAAPAAAQPGSDTYRIQPGDKLFISVWKEEGLAQTVVVRPDGRITFPLAGEFAAAGKTVDVVTGEIRDKLVRLIPEALVTVDVAEIRGARVYIIGQVQMPGQHLVNPSVDVMQALSMAGGLTAFASPGDVRILRRTANGQAALPFDYGAVIRGRNLDQNIMLQDGDVVIVP
jgi:polysaccharide biosynthesis/export protein